MTKEKVRRAAELRGIYFDGVKKWRNSMVGYGYEINLLDGGFMQADTLDGIYRTIMKYNKVSC